MLPLPAPVPALGWLVGLPFTGRVDDGKKLNVGMVPVAVAMAVPAVVVEVFESSTGLVAVPDAGCVVLRVVVFDTDRVARVVVFDAGCVLLVVAGSEEADRVLVGSAAEPPPR